MLRRMSRSRGVLFGSHQLGRTLKVDFSTIGLTAAGGAPAEGGLSNGTEECSRVWPQVLFAHRACSAGGVTSCGLNASVRLARFLPPHGKAQRLRDRHIDLVMLAVAKGIIHETVKEAGRQVRNCADMRACACAMCAVAGCGLATVHTRSLQRVSVRICSSILATMSARAQVRASVERQRDLQPERSEEVPVCDAFSGTPRKKVANLTFTIKQCRGLPAGTWESAGTVGTTDSYCVIKVCNAHSMRPSLARARVCARDVLTRAFSDTPLTETEPCEPGANRLSFDLRV